MTAAHRRTSIRLRNSRLRRIRITSVVILALSGCGDDGGSASDAGAVATVPAPSPTPPPAPTSTPTPTPTPAAAVDPYVLGTLTYTLNGEVPADKAVAIRDAMDFAVAHTNAIAAFTGNIRVVYSAGTPTADAGFLGQIRFGGSIGRRVALHELAHWLGSGSVREWGELLSGGRFTGALATARVKAFDGDAAVLNADGAHFWPYGLNYDAEFRETQRNTQIVAAQFADMRLGADAAAAVTGVRRFQNRSALLVLQGAAAGTAPVQAGNAAGGLQQWRVSYADGFVTLVNVDAGLALAGMASGDNAATAMATVSTGSLAQQWEMLPVGDAGWFLLRNRATGNCLDNIGNMTTGAMIRLWSCGFHPNQQWRLIR